MHKPQAKWSAEEDAFLRCAYSDAMWGMLLAGLPGRSKRAIWNHAHKLGLQRAVHEFPPETSARMAESARTRKPRLGKVLYPVIKRGGVPGKFCGECGGWKPLRNFSKQLDCSGGAKNICTTCEGRKAYAGNRRARIAGVRRYQKKHPEATRLRQQAARRIRNKRKLAGRGVTAKELRELMALYGEICAYCRTAKADTIDHVTPLSRGGKHEIENILPACKPCNYSKHTMTLEEWQAKKASRGA